MRRENTRALSAGWLVCLAGLASSQELIPPPPVYPTTEAAVIDPADLAQAAEALELAPPPAGPESKPDTTIVAEETPAALAAAQPHWYQVTYWLGPMPWDTSFEVGLNGSSGTSDTLSLRAGGAFRRKTDRRKIDVSLYHNKTQADGTETQNNALLDARHDWLFGKSPWTIYVLSQVYHDEFQSFDLNVNANAGIGFQWIDTERTKFLTRIGSGATREIGGSRDEWVPEAQFGIDYSCQVAEKQKFYGKIDYFPEWDGFNRYRTLTDVGYEIELSVPSNVSLKLAATDRFDSEPEGAKPHNTNYSVMLLWRL